MEKTTLLFLMFLELRFIRMTNQLFENDIQTIHSIEFNSYLNFKSNFKRFTNLISV